MKQNHQLLGLIIISVIIANFNLLASNHLCLDSTWPSLSPKPRLMTSEKLPALLKVLPCDRLGPWLCIRSRRERGRRHGIFGRDLVFD